MQVELASVTVLRCSKPNCRTGCFELRRHHRKGEHRWIKILESRRSLSAGAKQQLDAFKQRYESFDSRDTVLICANHHEEVHAAYEQLLQESIRAKHYRPLRRWKWQEIQAFMVKCETYCRWWMKQETPGLRSRTYTH